jgi:hypothetical protein
MANMRANVRSEDQPALVWWIRIAFLFLWATLLVHEGAHYLVARLLFSPSDWAGTASAWRQVAVWAAGPFASLLMVAASAVVVTNTRGQTLQRFALLASLGAASRLLVTAVPTMLGNANDERWIGSVTGLSARAIWGAEIIVTGWLVAWMFFRMERPGTSAVVASLAGIVLGWIAAFTFGRAIGLRI